MLAYVGQPGDLERARSGRRARAAQAGSTLKPFLYALAHRTRAAHAGFAAGRLAARARDRAAGLYVPQNYDREFKGLVSLRTALASSLNVPAVRTLACWSARDASPSA